MGAKGQSARERFKVAVREAGGAAKAAVLIDCSRAYVDMLVGGTRRPGLSMAYKIERVFGIAMQAWVEHEVKKD